MGDTGGRDLIFSFHSVDTNDEQTFLLAEAIPDIFTNLSAFENPSNFNASFCDPIKCAKVTKLVKADSAYSGARPDEKRYSGLSKPVYVQADILNEHLGRGESTQDSTEIKKIAKIIRDRGNSSPPDDCGHIIANQNGGKIIDYNLFPQNKQINRGIGVWSYIWKWGVELLIRIWLVSQADSDPMVRVRIRLFYPSSTSPNPDRPTGFHYHFQFYKRRREQKRNSGDENSSNAIALTLFIRAAIYGEVPNECTEIDGKKTKESMKALCKHLQQLREMARPAEMKELLKIYSDEIERFLNPPQSPKASSSSTPTPLSSNKPFSWWDVVPIVGSVRTLDDAIECGKNGDGLGAGINTVLGVGGLALDVISLGTISTFGKVAAKQVVTEGTKQGTKLAIKTGAQQVFKIAVEQMIKEGIEALTQTVVTQTARRAIELIAKNAN